MESHLFEPQFKPQFGTPPNHPIQMTTFQLSISNRNGGWFFFNIDDDDFFEFSDEKNT